MLKHIMVTQLMDVQMMKKLCQYLVLMEKHVCLSASKIPIAQLMNQAVELQNQNVNFYLILVDPNIAYQLLLIMVKLQEHVPPVQKQSISGGFKFACTTQINRTPLKLIKSCDLKKFLISFKSILCYILFVLLLF